METTCGPDESVPNSREKYRAPIFQMQLEKSYFFNYSLIEGIAKGVHFWLSLAGPHCCPHTLGVGGHDRPLPFRQKPSCHTSVRSHSHFHWTVWLVPASVPPKALNRSWQASSPWAAETHEGLKVMQPEPAMAPQPEPTTALQEGPSLPLPQA